MPTNENPADLPTRGMTTDELRHINLWWQGPDWLIMNESHWPQSPICVKSGITWPQSPICVESGITEDPNEATVMVAATGSFESPIGVMRFSVLIRLLRVFDWVLRSKEVTLKQRRTGELDPSEVSVSLNRWVQMNQDQFATDHPAEFELAHKQLKLFVDPTGILRCSVPIGQRRLAVQRTSSSVYAQKII